MRARRARLLACAFCLAGFLAAPSPARPGEPPPQEDDPDKKSLPLRTALHHDPTLGAPLARLLEIYREAGRVDDLLQMYRAHAAQYPHDARGLVVLVRLLEATGDPGAEQRARAAAERHPKNAYLRYVLYRTLRAKQKKGALDALAKAIAVEPLPGRKRAWIEALLSEAKTAGRRDLMERHLALLGDLAGDAPAARLAAAETMMRFGFHGLALEILKGAAKLVPPPETGVEIELATATAELGLDRASEAAARLDRLLGRVTADYWRRDEILRRRLALVRTEAERQAMLDAARARVAAQPDDEAAVLELAQLFAGFQFRRDALEALIAGSRRLPGSARIERATLDLFDRLRDERGRAAWLAERAEANPDRMDLALLHAKSLFLLGRRKGAFAKLDALAAKLGPEERRTRLLETARSLRRVGLSADAAELFRRVLELAPERDDVRRELAESYLATGGREKARALFASAPPEDTSTENLLDAVQFMIKEEMFVEARARLRARCTRDEANLALRLLLLTVEGRLGERRAGERLALETRKLADTDVRYRQWLEASVAFHETFDALDAFLEAEGARLDLGHGGWTQADLERRLALADVAARCRHEAAAAVMLQARLGEDAPPEARVRLRRQLIQILQNDRTRSADLERELKAQVKDDPDFAQEASARLAVLYAAFERMDKAAPLLAELDLGALHDPVLVGALERLYAGEGATYRVLESLERLTGLDPTNRSTWERWIEGLACTGDEARLRRALRRLLAGETGAAGATAERMPIADATRALLRRHLADSCWRSIGEIAERSPQGTAYAEALVLLDAAADVAELREEGLWVAWTRAFLLNRLGREAARDEAIQELERLASEPATAEEEAEKEGAEGEAPAEEKAPPFKGILFPDGLAVTLKHARGLLTAPFPGSKAQRAPDREGPLPELKARWVFELAADACITRVLPLDEGARLLVSDTSGTLSCLDAGSGKLLWEQASGVPAAPAQGEHHYEDAWGRYFEVTVQGVAPLPVSASPRREGRAPQAGPPESGRLLVPGPACVRCLSAGDGRLLWQAEIGGGQPASKSVLPSPVAVFVRGRRALVCDPVSGAAACLDLATGKLCWENLRPARTGGQPASASAGAGGAGGAAACGRRLLVYGARAAILDAETGQTQWIFDPSRVRSFPVELKKPPETSEAAAAGPTARLFNLPGAGSSVPPPPALPALHLWGRMPPGYPAGPWPGRPYGRRRGFAPQPPQVQFINHLTRGMAHWSPQVFPRARAALVAPAVAWAAAGEGSGASRLGVLAGERLLLFDDSGLLVLHLDLPLAGRRFSVSGTFVGIAGDRTACVLGPEALVSIDLVEGTVLTCALAEIAEGEALVSLQATVDGPHVYVTGPGGVACLSARTHQIVFKASWPKDAVRPARGAEALVLEDAATTAAPAPPVPPSMPARAHWFTGGRDAQHPPTYAWRGVSFWKGDGYGPCVPLATRAAGGVLYAVTSPGRLVALEGRGR